MIKAKLGSSQEMTSVSNPCVGVSMIKLNQSGSGQCKHTMCACVHRLSGDTCNINIMCLHVHYTRVQVTGQYGGSSGTCWYWTVWSLVVWYRQSSLGNKK